MCFASSWAGAALDAAPRGFGAPNRTVSHLKGVPEYRDVTRRDNSRPFLARWGARRTRILAPTHREPIAEVSLAARQSRPLHRP